jgi:hypothetical protein
VVVESVPRCASDVVVEFTVLLVDDEEEAREMGVNSANLLVIVIDDRG